MKKLAVISGKGGTGKTSVTAALATLAGRVVLADCDVDAPDLHLLTEPRIQQQGAFTGGRRATINAAACSACGHCASACRFEAIAPTGPADESASATYRVDPLGCEGCGACALVCPASAIRLEDAVCGEWYDSETRFGPMAHARLHPGHENSGKLVTLVRRRAEELARAREIGLVLIDGAPGIGCPVIASITGCDLLLAVTEPSASGVHDLERVLDLAGQFRIPAMVCINRCNGPSTLEARIHDVAAAHDAPMAGRLRYDRAVVRAQFRRQSVIECGNSEIAQDLRELWDQLRARLLPHEVEARPAPMRAGGPGESDSAVRRQVHPACFVCSPAHSGGLGLRFVPGPDGSVSAEFACDGGFEGYEGLVHGGIVSALLDGAMTNCLFARGHVAVTADLHVRFRHPLRIGLKAVVRARLTRDASPLFVLEAQVIQADQVKATAVGKFMLRSGRAQ